MSELQTEKQEELQIENIQEQEIQQPGTAESGSELATDSDGQHKEQDHESSANQEAINKAINKKHYQMMEERREKEALQVQLQQLQQQTSPQAPVIPPVPDAFEDNFESLLAERDKAVQAKAAFDSNQNYMQQQQQDQQQQQFQQHEKLIQEKLINYKDRAKAVGISDVDLQSDANTVTAYGMRGDLSEAILGDKDGPLIAKYLANNPNEIEKLNGMNTYQFAMHVERSVRPEAVKFKPRITETPNPAVILSGNGADPEAGQYMYIKGAKFE